MKKCNQCGAWIDFVTTQAGRHMPVEPRPVIIMPNRGTAATAAGMAVTA